MGKDQIGLLPRHLQLREQLLQRWRKAGLRPGDKVESQNEILSWSDFSLSTVIKTLRDLEASRVIRREVGRGTFLSEPPWSSEGFAVGFVYERETVGGGILSNGFYSPMLMHLESQVMKKGHAFSYASCSANSLTQTPDMNGLVFLTAIMDAQIPQVLSEETNALVMIDGVMSLELGSSFYLDFSGAYADLASWANRLGKNKILYVDTTWESSERKRRKMDFESAISHQHPNAQIFDVHVDVEYANDLIPIHDVIRKTQPDVICGYLKQGWERELEERYPGKSVVTLHIDEKGSDLGIHLDMQGWMSLVFELSMKIARGEEENVVREFQTTFFNETRS